jgi:hypothetical protein
LTPARCGRRPFESFGSLADLVQMFVLGIGRPGHLLRNCDANSRPQRRIFEQCLELIDLVLQFTGGFGVRYFGRRQWALRH